MKKGRGTAKLWRCGFHPPVFPRESVDAVCCHLSRYGGNTEAAKPNSHLLVFLAPCGSSGCCSPKRLNDPKTVFIHLEPASAIEMGTR